MNLLLINLVNLNLHWKIGRNCQITSFLYKFRLFFIVTTKPWSSSTALLPFLNLSTRGSVLGLLILLNYVFLMVGFWYIRSECVRHRDCSLPISRVSVNDGLDVNGRREVFQRCRHNWGRYRSLSIVLNDRIFLTVVHSWGGRRSPRISRILHWIGLQPRLLWFPSESVKWRRIRSIVVVDGFVVGRRRSFGEIVRQVFYLYSCYPTHFVL